jgi:hypothetical protein
MCDERIYIQLRHLWEIEGELAESLKHTGQGETIDGSVAAVGA